MDVQVEQLAAGNWGHDRQGAQILLAPSAAALGDATGLAVPEAGAGIYLGVFWGQRPTGGYAIRVTGGAEEGGAITIRLATHHPERGAMVTQVLTSPYAIAVIRDRQLARQAFTFRDQQGTELAWPLRHVEG